MVMGAEKSRGYEHREHDGVVVRKPQNILEQHPLNQKRRSDGKLPANSIWLWGEGKTPSISTLNDLYEMKGGLISAVDLLKGIGVCAGLEIINVPGATGYIDTNYQGKVDAAKEVLERDDFFDYMYNFGEKYLLDIIVKIGHTINAI